MIAKTTDVVEIRQSPLKMLALIAIGIVLTAACAGIAFHRALGIAATSYQEFVGYVGLIFFGLCVALSLWRLFSVRGPVITISSDGIRDTRVAAEVVPWSAIRGISTWHYRRQKMMVLALDPAVESRLTLTRLARWSREPNRALGADGLCIAATGLDISYDTLLQTALAHADKGRPSGH